MTGNMKTFTVTIGRDIPQAAALGYPCAWLVYTAGENGLRLQAQPMGRGGLLGFYVPNELPSPETGSRLAGAIADQVRRRGFSGVLLDLPPTEAGAALAAGLCPRLASLGLVHYVPIELAPAAPQAKLILPSAISGGSFDEMLAHFSGLYPPGRLCLELVRTRNDFTMPSPDAEGKPLSGEDFDRLLEQAGGSYYSPELCCRYFTYAGPDGQPHFVMFDDAETARVKALRASRAGFFACFALYAEWGGEIGRIFA